MPEPPHPKHARYQVAIIGGGPAGLMTAIAAAQEGAESVLLIERKRQWGVPVQCAEYVPKLITRIIEVPSDAVANRINDLALFLEGEQIGSVRAPGFILHRQLFEQELARKAKELGVECLLGARVAEVGEGRLTTLIGADPKEIRAEIIVGADGPHSILREQIDPAPPDLARGLQYTLPLSRASNAAEVHFSPRYGAGYAWCFPKGEVANVGLALDPDRLAGELRALLDEFTSFLKKEKTIADAKPLRTSGGLIPISGPAAVTVKDNVLLVGDAAGQTNSLTGAGIYTALACGRLAGKAVAKALRDGNLSRLQTYETVWRDLFERFLSDALSARNRLAAADGDKCLDAVRDSWKIARRKRN